MFVSVIVPVFNDARGLRLCLQALAEQTYSQNGYEVIVVDNGSEAAMGIPAVVRDFAIATYVFEPVPGAYAARNRGMSLAKGQILAFTDADCIPAADWLEKGVGHLQAVANCGLVAGQVKMFFAGEQANPVELYESVTAFPQQALLNQHKGAATANVFTFKTVMDQVGPFDASLKSQGDLEWGRRVYMAGYEQLYADDVCVAHPARRTLKDLTTRTKRLAGGAFGRLVQSQPEGWARQRALVRLIGEDLVPPVNFALSAFKDSRLPGFWQKLVVPLVLVWVRYVSAIEKVRLNFGSMPNRG